MNGAYGEGLLAFEQVFDAVPSIAFSVLLFGAIWIICGRPT